MKNVRYKTTAKSVNMCSTKSGKYNIDFCNIMSVNKDKETVVRAALGDGSDVSHVMST
jgi:hypothetical protein